MYIHEAIKARTADKPFIARESWRDELSGWKACDLKINPTDSPDCCIIESRVNKSPYRGWQPRKEDLLANDWIPVS